VEYVHATSTRTAGELLESAEAWHPRNLCQREPFHLFRYLDEQAFRFNERKGTDRSRFVQVLRDRRPPADYKHLIGMDAAFAQ